MKYLFLSLLAGLLMVNARANDTARLKKTPEQKAAVQADKMKAELALTDAQRNQVYEACLKRIQDADAIKAKSSNVSDKKGRKSDLKAVQSAFDTRMKEILTADQYTKWCKKKEEHKARAKSKHKNLKTP